MSTTKLDDVKTNFLGEQYQMPILDEGANSTAPLEQAIKRHEIDVTSNIRAGGNLIVGGAIVAGIQSADEEVEGHFTIELNDGKYELLFVVTKPTGKDAVVLADDLLDDA